MIFSNKGAVKPQIDLNIDSHKGPVTQRFMAKARQRVVSREADDVVRVDVEFTTNYSRFIDTAGRGQNRNGVGRAKKFWTA